MGTKMRPKYISGKQYCSNCNIKSQLGKNGKCVDCDRAGFYKLYSAKKEGK